jgi:hypothetical protein
VGAGSTKRRRARAEAGIYEAAACEDGGVEVGGEAQTYAGAEREVTGGWEKKMRREAAVFIMKMKVGDLLRGLQCIFSSRFEYGCVDE